MTTPTTAPVPQPAAAASYLSPELPGVLVVDDDIGIRAFLHAALTCEGFRVWLADGRATAVSTLTGHRTDIRIALMDVRMPGGDGPDVLRDLRRIKPDLQAVFMSGTLDDDLTESLLRLGVVGVLDKPLSLARVVAFLTSAVGPADERQ